MDRLWRLVANVSALVLAGLVAIVLALAVSGVLRLDRLRAAALALREGPPPPAPPAAPEPPDEAERRRAADAIARREEELGRLETRIAARQQQIEAERLRVAEAAARLKGEREAFERARRESVDTELAADLAANVPILSKLDGASIVGVLKAWDDPTFVRYLRALRPSKAAEVIDALQNDPRFEAEFRRVPAGAPRGARTRAELLMDELKKSPQG
jgi:hypothetical protein